MMMMYNKVLALAAVVMVAFPGAVPAGPGDGVPSGEPGVFPWRDKPLRPMPSSPLAEVAPRVTGTAKVLLLCIEFSNVKHNGAHTPAYFDALADGPGNSMAAYFHEASGGRFTIAADCQGWYTSTQTMEHYGAPSGGQKDNPLLYELVTEAVRAADAQVNFADYDLDRDGWVDYLQVVHAGRDEAMSGSPNDIWSEMYYDFDTPVVDGKRVGIYSMVSEYDPMGVFAHELGHQIGLPDLYDTDGPGNGGDTDGAGLWDIMAAGAFLGNGDVPSLPSAWSRTLLGWTNLLTVTSNTNGLQLASAARNGTVLRINVPGIPNEYYLVECRVQTGFDSHLPGSGLLIWHIDDSRGNLNLNDLETRPGKKRVTLEEAHGGVQHLDRAGLKLYDPQDPWSNSAGGFSPTSDPNTTANLDGRHTFISVRNIGPASYTMSCDVVLNTPVYDLRLTPSGTRFDIDPGVTSHFTVDAYNVGSDEEYSFSVEGKFTEWFNADPARTVLTTRNAIGLTVFMRPPVTAPAGTAFEDTLRATASSDRTRSFTIKFSVRVNAKLHSAFSPSMDIGLLPGAPRTVELAVENRGNLADTITLSIQGPGAGWVSYEGPETFQLAAGSNDTLRLTASIPFGTEQNARTTVEVGGRSRDGSRSDPATLSLWAGPSPYIVFGALEEVRVRPGVPSAVRVHLDNLGTADAVLSLATEAPPGWFANLSRESILIPAWGSEDVPLSVTAPEGAPAGTVAPVNLTAAAGAYLNSTSIPVTVEQVYGVALFDCSTSAEVLPGVPHEYRFTVGNTGNGRDDLVLDIIEGPTDGQWTQSLDTRALRLGPGENATVAVTVTAPAGALAGARWEVTLGFGHTGGETTEFELVSTVARLRTVSVAAAQRAKSGDPGETVSFQFSATNTGNAADSVLFSAPKQAGLVLEFSEPDYSLDPSERVDLRLSCRILAGAQAGLRSIILTASARDDPSVNATVDLRLTVNAIHAVELQFQRTQAEAPAGGSVVFPCTLQNTGNTRDTFTLSRVSGTLEVLFDRSTVTLEPGEKVSINITATVPSGEPGGPSAFKVSVRSQGKAGEVFLKELAVDVSAAPGGGGNALLVPIAAAGALGAAAVAAALLVLRRRKKKSAQ